VSAIFTINFRREAYLKELARTRRRLYVIGGWVAYYGLLVVILGLYGLNCFSLTGRVKQIEVQEERIRAAQHHQDEWQVGTSELVQIARYEANPRLWRDRLTRLASILPANATVTSIAVNPDNLSGASEMNALVITGVMRVPGSQDRMQDVVRLVGAMHADSVFSRSYSNIRLASSRSVDLGGGEVQFVIECR